MDPFFPKTLKRYHSDVSDISSSEDEKIYNLPKISTSTNYPRFLVIELLERKKMSELSPFLIEKVLTGKSNPKSIKKLRDGNLLVEVNSNKDAQNLLKMYNFYNYKCKVFPHGKLNTSKGVIRNQELSLATTDEIRTAFKKQGVIDHKRITIKRNGQNIQTNTYILTFDTPTIPKELKIGYLIEKVEQYIPTPLRCHKCHKYGHHQDVCRGMKICGKCSERGPIHTEDECQNDEKCPNCNENHPAYSKTCKIYQKEKEITEVKHKRNISYPEARKIVESYLKSNTYAEATQKTSPSRQQNETNDQYRKLIEKLVKLDQNEWPKFQENLKELYSNMNNKSKQTANPNIKGKNMTETEIKKKIAPIQVQEDTKKATNEPAEDMKKATKEKTSNKEPAEKQKTQPITTQNRFQTLEKAETENNTAQINESTIKKTKANKQDKKRKDPKITVQPQLNRSQTRTQTLTRHKITNSSEMEIDER